MMKFFSTSAKNKKTTFNPDFSCTNVHHGYEISAKISGIQLNLVILAIDHWTGLEKRNEMILGVSKTQYKLNLSSFLPSMIPKIFIQNQVEPTQIDIQLFPSKSIPNYPLVWV